MGTTVAAKKPAKNVSKETSCLGVDLAITIPEDDFDPTVFSDMLGGREFDFVHNAVSGPVRLGGRGKDDFRITAVIERHPTTEDSHYYIVIHATQAQRPVAAKSDWPTTAEFFRTVARGIREPSEVTTRVIGQHAYPRDWWRGMELPQPLPFGTQSNRSDAELTGLEVAYKSDDGPETVLLTARTEVFVVVTQFTLSGPVREDWFYTAVRRSASIGERLFQQVAQKETL
jgi:hypothetical protein